MKTIHYSDEIKRQMSGRAPRVRRRMSSEQKKDLRDFFVWLFALAAFAAACASYIGLI